MTATSPSTGHVPAPMGLRRIRLIPGIDPTAPQILQANAFNRIIMSNSKPMPCADPDFLQRYLREQLDESEDARVQRHVGGCKECQALLEQAAGEPSLWKSVNEHLSQEVLVDGADDSAPQRLEDLKKFLAPTDDPAMLGRLGHFEVCGLIGQGSTGIVLKALEPRLNRYVAIKLMSSTYASSAVARKRFEREGRAVAAVAHEHVVPIYCVDEHGDSPYIVMKYVSGLSLQQRIERDGPLDSCEVTRIGLQVAKALAAAHAQGIVHRDVKPANVILESTVDRAMVTDFGLAQVADEASMTRSGTITGTPQYMSPEQAKGESVDPRSDLFSLGSLMYAACTGRPPFRAQTIFGVINRVCESNPRAIRELNPHIREWLESFIGKLMAKHPDDRFDSAEEVVSLLSSELAHLQNPTAVAQPRRNWLALSPPAAKPAVAGAGGRRWRAALALAGAGALAALGYANLPNRGAANGSVSNAGLLGAAAQLDAQTEDPFQDAEASWVRHASGDDRGVAFEQVLQQSVPLDPSGTLTLQADYGRVDVQPSDSDELTLSLRRHVIAETQEQAELLLSNHRVRSAATAEGFALTTAFDPEFVDREGLDDFQSIQIRIGIPEGYDADVSALHGDVSIGALAGNVRVSARGGDIALARIGGTVDVRSQGGDVNLSEGCAGKADIFAIHGDVHVAEVQATARVRTSGGDVLLGTSPGSVSVQTSGGFVAVYGLCGCVNVYTSHGDIDVRVPDKPQQLCDFGAIAGNVSILLAEDLALDVESRGSLETTLPVDLKENSIGLPESFSLTHNNGGGPASIRATSSVGTVRIATYAGDSDPALLTSFELDSSAEYGASAREVGDEEVASGLGGSGLGGSGLGGSGLGGSGLGGSGLGGSGSLGSSATLSEIAQRRTTGEPRPGALIAMDLDEVTGNIDGYNLYLPISYDSHQGTYPVLVYLQGAYGVGGEVEDINNWGLPRLLRDETDLTSERNQLLMDEFIVVSPHIVEGNYDEEPQVVQAILDRIFATYRADPERVFLTGLSRGGAGSWGLAARLPETFAAIVPVACNASSVDDFSSLANPAIWIAHNEGDGISDYSGAMDAALAVEEHSDAEFYMLDSLDVTGTDFLEHRHLFTTGMSSGHDAWTELYSSAEFYRWLLHQRRIPQGKEHGAF